MPSLAVSPLISNQLMPSMQLLPFVLLLMSLRQLIHSFTIKNMPITCHHLLWKLVPFLLPYMLCYPFHHRQTTRTNHNLSFMVDQSGICLHHHHPHPHPHHHPPHPIIINLLCIHGCNMLPYHPPHSLLPSNHRPLVPQLPLVMLLMLIFHGANQRTPILTFILMIPSTHPHPRHPPPQLPPPPQQLPTFANILPYLVLH